MQTTLSMALDLLAAAAAPDGTRRDFRIEAISVLANGAVEAGNGPRSAEYTAVPAILDVLVLCLGSERAEELPHLVTGLFRTVFEFASPESEQPYPTAALLYERITRAADLTLEIGWRGRAQERLATDVAQWRGKASTSAARGSGLLRIWHAKARTD
jgi:hypothetical protein